MACPDEEGVVRHGSAQTDSYDTEDQPLDD